MLGSALICSTKHLQEISMDSLSGGKIEFPVNKVSILHCQEYLSNLMPFVGQNSKSDT